MGALVGAWAGGFGNTQGGVKRSTRKKSKTLFDLLFN